jgi:hypothetical protein
MALSAQPNAPCSHKKLQQATGSEASPLLEKLIPTALKGEKTVACVRSFW